MRLVHSVLGGIEENKALSEQGDYSLPLLGLAEAYNRQHGQKFDHIELNETTTGRELMIALAGLRMKDKIALLHLYKDSLRVVELANSQALIEELRAGEVVESHSIHARLESLQALELEEKIKFRALARKVLLFVGAPIPPLIAGAMVVIAVQKGMLMPEGLAGSLMTTATEILKLIFSS